MPSIVNKKTPLSLGIVWWFLVYFGGRVVAAETLYDISVTEPWSGVSSAHRDRQLQQDDDSLPADAYTLLSEQLEQLSALVQTLQEETTTSVKQEITTLQSSTTDALDEFKIQLQTSLLQERQVILQKVETVVQDFEGELRGLQRELETEAAVLLGELEGAVTKTATIGGTVIFLLLLMSLCCGCGCGSCVVYLATRRARKAMMDDDDIMEATAMAPSTIPATDMSLQSLVPVAPCQYHDNNEVADVFRDETTAKEETSDEGWYD